METSWLIERLDNPALLQKGDEQRLRELIATYPYFSAPYLLLARSLHDQKHPAFEQLLPLISLQAFDRKRLFKLIHEETMDHRPWTIAEEEREAVPAAGAVSEAEVKVEVEVEEMRGLGDEEEGRRGDEEDNIVRHAERSRSKTDEPEVSDEEKVSIPRFAVNFSEVEKTEKEPIPAVHEELQEIPFLLTMDHGPWTIAEEEREAVPAAKVEVEVEEMRGLGDEENEIVRRPEQANELSDIEETSHRVEGPEPITHNPAPNPSEKIDFIHWLEKLQPVKKAEGTRRLGDEENDMVHHLSEEPVLSLPKESATDLTETTDKEVFLHGSASLTMTEDHNPEPETHNQEPITRHPEQANVSSDIEETPRRVEGPDPNALIDKFIETNPSVSRVKERFYDPAVQARESERLDDNLMTETLARIFVKQEKYERAIDAYRKLQLKYPEKSDYFAALILEINSKIN